MPGVNLAGQLSSKVSLAQKPVNFMHHGHSPTDRATDERITDERNIRFLVIGPCCRLTYVWCRILTPECMHTIASWGSLCRRSVTPWDGGDRPVRRPSLEAECGHVDLQDSPRGGFTLGLRVQSSLMSRTFGKEIQALGTLVNASIQGSAWP